MPQEPQIGIEPMTARLRIGCSTTELLWRIPGEPDHRRCCRQRCDQGPAIHYRVANALARTRTAKPFGTTTSRWRVYQFHHEGVLLRSVMHPPCGPSAATASQLLVSHLRERRGSNPRPLE